MIKHKKYFLPQNPWSMCSLTCVYWIFNYFWNTAFNRKDNREMMQLMKWWKYTWSEMLDLPEISYMLEKLWFDVHHYYWYNEETHIQYLEDPISTFPQLVNSKYHSFIQWNVRKEPWSGNWFDYTDTSIWKKVYENEKIKKTFKANFERIIKSEASENSLFIVWLNFDILHQLKPEPWIAWGHVVIVQEMIWDNYIVHDPWPPLLPYHNFHKDIFHSALLDMWEYEFIKISK